MGKQILDTEEICACIKEATGKEARFDSKTREYYIEEDIIRRRRDGFFTRMFR